MCCKLIDTRFGRIGTGNAVALEQLPPGFEYVDVMFTNPTPGAPICEVFTGGDTSTTNASERLFGMGFTTASPTSERVRVYKSRIPQQKLVLSSSGPLADYVIEIYAKE